MYSVTGSEIKGAIFIVVERRMSLPVTLAILDGPRCCIGIIMMRWAMEIIHRIRLEGMIVWELCEQVLTRAKRWEIGDPLCVIYRVATFCHYHTHTAYSIQYPPHPLCMDPIITFCLLSPSSPFSLPSLSLPSPPSFLQFDSVDACIVDNISVSALVVILFGDVQPLLPVCLKSRQSSPT